MTRNKAVWRSLWLTALLIQIVLYYLSYPHLMAVVIHNHMEGNLTFNVVALDLLGAGAWIMLLVFAEERAFRGSKWFNRIGIFAFILLTVCVMLTNLNAWKY